MHIKIESGWMIRLLNKVVLILGVALIIYAVILFIKFPKNQGIILLVFIGSVLLLHALAKKQILAITKNGLLKYIRIIFTGGFCILILTFSFFCLASLIASNHVPKSDSDAIIVLGAGLKGDKISKVLSYRLEEALEYYRKNPDAIIVVAGGQGEDELISEAQAMQRYLADAGVSKDKILLEDKSTSTLENFAFSKIMLDDRFERGGYSIVYVTNSFHYFRAGIYAKMAGLNADYLSADTPIFLIPGYFARDYMALAYLLVFER